jgi:transposase
MPIRLHFMNTGSPTLVVPLDLADVTILDAYLDDQGACQITVESAIGHATCHRCGQVITASHGYGELVTVRHLAVWGRPTYITLCPRCFVCPDCSSPGHVVTNTEMGGWGIAYTITDQARQIWICTRRKTCISDSRPKFVKPST